MSTRASIMTAGNADFYVETLDFTICVQIGDDDPITICTQDEWNKAEIYNSGSYLPGSLIPRVAVEAE